MISKERKAGGRKRKDEDFETYFHFLEHLRKKLNYVSIFKNELPLKVIPTDNIRERSVDWHKVNLPPK